MTSAPTALGTHRAVEQALFGFGMFLPLLGGGNLLFTFGPEEAVPVLCAAAVATSLLLVLQKPDRPARGSTRAASGFLALFAIVWVSNLLFRAAGPRAQLEATGPLAGMLMFAAFARRSPGAEGFSSLVAGLLAGVFLTTLFGQYQYWIAFPRVTVLMRETGLSPFLSVNANFYNANCYAAFLAATSLLAAIWLTRGSQRSRILAILAVAAALVTLVLTQSRSAIFLLLGAAALAALRLEIRSPRKVLLGGGLLAAALALIAAPLIDAPELWRAGLLGRIAIWQGGWRMAVDNWVVGVGVGRFAEYFDTYKVTEYYTRYPHNFLLEIAAETGVVGLAPLLAFFAAASAAPLAWLQRAPWRTRPREPLAVVLACGVLLAHAALDIDWHAPANPVLLLLLLGALQRMSDLEPALSAATSAEGS